MDNEVLDCFDGLWEKPLNERNQCLNKIGSHITKMQGILNEAEVRDTQTFQHELAKFIIGKGHPLVGGYVYKTLVNGDRSSDLDVKVKEEQDDTDVKNLLGELKKKFKCEEVTFREHPRYDRTIQGHSLVCPFNTWDSWRKTMQKSYMGIDVIIKSPEVKNDIFKLQYKQVDGVPTIVDEDGDTNRRDRVIKELKARQFRSWNDMRLKDKDYFNKTQWTDLNNLTAFQRMKQMFKKDE